MIHKQIAKLGTRNAGLMGIVPSLEAEIQYVLSEY